MMPGADATLNDTPAWKRDRALELLRHAADRGVSKRDFHDSGIPCPMVHVESLRFEDGIAIETRTLRTANGGYEDRWVLVRDERR